MSFYIREYNKRTKIILENAIKSAVFIDENALEPFTKETQNGKSDATETEKLTKKIYRHFRKKNVSFDIHKFESVEIAKLRIKNKDIVLLDWHLDGEKSGEIYALQLLEEIVKENQIHFCCIYTNSEKSSVINNCISYFSGYSKQFCTEVLEEFELDKEMVNKINPFLEKLFGYSNPNDPVNIGRIIGELKKKDGLVKYINSIEPLLNLSLSEKINCLLYATKDDLLKSNSNKTPKINLLNKSDYSFLINNTIIIILNKDYANDSQLLLKKISNEIIKKQNSYLLMLGLEMQNQIKKSSSFISGKILNVSNSTIAYHWNQSNLKQDGDAIGFKNFIKQVMAEQVSINISKSHFTLLNESKLLKTNAIRKNPDPEQLSKVNTFYNGSLLNFDKPLSYGDIFLHKESSSYFLCVTALCDSLHPINIKNKFFFVRGTIIKIEEAIDLSDEAFISYINGEISISWVPLVKGSKNDNRKPVYIKPIQLFVPEPEIKNMKIKVYDWEKSLVKIKELELEYKFTLRQNYTQRIANHAFSHPIRVGIDFVKKNKS